MTPEIRFWGPPLEPEEIELADEYMATSRRGHGLDESAVVYVLLLSDGAVYLGISKDADRRLTEHARAARHELPVGVARKVTESPSELFLALHGAPTLIALVACPTRRHALLYESMLTARLWEAGVKAFGAGYDQTAPRWGRNQAGGELFDDPDELLALVTQGGE